MVESDSKPFNGDPNRSVGLNLAVHNAKSGVPRGVRVERGRGPNPTLGRPLTMWTRSRTKVCLCNSATISLTGSSTNHRVCFALIAFQTYTVGTIVLRSAGVFGGNRKVSIAQFCRNGLILGRNIQRSKNVSCRYGGQMGSSISGKSLLYL